MSSAKNDALTSRDDDSVNNAGVEENNGSTGERRISEEGDGRELVGPSGFGAATVAGAGSATRTFCGLDESHHMMEDTCRRNDADTSSSILDVDGDSEDETSTTSCAQPSLKDETPITSMQQLVEKFFGDNGIFRPRYSYAQVMLPAIKRSTTPLDHNYTAMLTHDCVLHFLAPHEILALWQTSKTTWESMTPKQRRFIMMRAVFGFLRISEEAAQHVSKLIIGGWRAYCPLMVSLCEHLARVYGSFEVDMAHRVFMAHQACFYPKSRGFWRCGSKLAEHEVHLARVLDFRDRHMINYSQPTSKLPPPTMAVLKMDSHIGWGNAETYTEQQTAMRTDCLMKHQSWMQEHAKEAPNMHYRLRLERGLSPCLWVDQCVHLSPDNTLELQLWALGIGSKQQQFLSAVSTAESEARDCSFCHCLEYDPSSPSCMTGGFMELIMRRSHSAALDIHREYDGRYWPTLGILIWFMRRGLAPFADGRVDWKALVNEVCRADSELFRRFYREGFVPWDPFGPHAPRPDPVDRDFVEREKHFYLDALESPLFGQADFRKYV